MSSASIQSDPTLLLRRSPHPLPVITTQSNINRVAHDQSIAWSKLHVHTARTERLHPIAHTMTFYNPKAYAYQGHGKSMPLELTNSRLYIQAGLAARPGELVQRRLRVDTGSEDSIDDDTVRSSPVTEKTTLGKGLGRSYEDLSGFYDTVVIGPFKFQHVWGPAGAVAIIGMEMMRRFTLAFDATHGLLYLEPNSSFGEPVPAPS